MKSRVQEKIKFLMVLLFTGFSTLFLIQCTKNESVPTENNSPGAGSTDESLKINTEKGWSDSPFISRDGMRLYFMYSRYNFGPWILSSGAVLPQAEGPDRPGLHKSEVNPFDESDIYMAQKNLDGSWSTPVALGLNGAFGDASGMEIENGNKFIWLQGNGTNSKIVMAQKNPDGSWGASVDLGVGINNLSFGVLQDNPHITPDGQGLFFISNRPGGNGEKDIWFSFNSGGLINGTWSAPVVLSATFNSTGDEDQMWINPTTNDMYWNSPQGIKFCVSNGSTCSSVPTLVVIPGCDYPAEVSMPDDGSIMYFGCGSFSTGRVKIMYSVKQVDQSWGPAIAVD